MRLNASLSATPTVGRPPSSNAIAAPTKAVLKKMTTKYCTTYQQKAQASSGPRTLRDLLSWIALKVMPSDNAKAAKLTESAVVARPDNAGRTKSALSERSTSQLA